jgi:hypothetical protein
MDKVPSGRLEIHSSTQFVRLQMEGLLPASIPVGRHTPLPSIHNVYLTLRPCGAMRAHCMAVF